MRARDLIIDLPVIDLNASVGDAVRLLAERDLPGLIVVGDDGSPYMSCRAPRFCGWPASTGSPSSPHEKLISARPFSSVTSGE
ncbi:MULTISPECIES: hypothetical protein [Nonomuraea]|uniref:CBS domain-containing protein n=1 Tax=Nonomuraea ferruginea TaxID=46174 RepID=A0ABT4SQN5_9ACTN|nr:hypothetical protein [Nonomuraea ferruginea]MDA0639568.1 hypothetical protein [Nonomuraea ferruginea]